MLLTEKPTKRAAAHEAGRSIKQIPGFDHWSTPLPKDIQHEDIIKRYPNHLFGEVLLTIAATWTPKEISITSGRPELTANALVKRIKAAKIKRDGLPGRSSRKSAKASNPAPAPAAPTAEPPPPQPPVEPVPDHDSELTFPESEASRRFRNEQTELREILMEFAPDRVFDKFSAVRPEKDAALDQHLLSLAVAIREQRRRLSE